MDTWVWSVLLLLLGFAIIFVEMFIPSGGVLGVLSVLAVGSSIALAFMTSWQCGVTMLIVACLGVPLILMSAVKWWPNTPIGRLIVARPPSADDVLPAPEESQRLQQLVGQRGVARSKMLPSGIVEIDGQTFDAFSEGMPIEPGQTVEVVEVKMRRLEVRLVTADAPRASEPPAKKPPTNADDVLSQPIESLGIDPLDPLA